MRETTRRAEPWRGRYAGAKRRSRKSGAQNSTVSPPPQTRRRADAHERSEKLRDEARGHPGDPSSREKCPHYSLFQTFYATFREYTSRVFNFLSSPLSFYFFFLQSHFCRRTSFSLYFCASETPVTIKRWRLQSRPDVRTSSSSSSSPSS